MNKRNTTFSIAAVLAASAFVLQAPVASAAGDTTATGTSQSVDGQPGVPGVELNVGNNASDRGLPGVEMNIGPQGDQDNLDTTRTLGAGADTRGSLGTDGDGSTMRPMQADRG